MNSGTISNFPASMLSAFGTLETAELTPVFQGDFVYGLNTQNWNTAVVNGTGAAVAVSSGRLSITSGATTTGNYAYITSKRIIRYRAGQGNVVRLTPLFTTGVANNIQLWGVGTIASNAPIDGYFFGYNGTAFGIAHYNNNATATWYPQTSWNQNTLIPVVGSTSTYDPTKGSPVMIKYPFLGYGDIEFFVQNPFTGGWILVHVIRYANTSASIQLGNPSMQIIGWTSNSGTAGGIVTQYCGSVGIFLSGLRNFASNPKWAFTSNQTSVTTEKMVFNLKTASSYNGVVNRGMVRLNTLSIAQTANGVATVYLKINAAVGGSPSYTPISGSTADTGVTITAGNSIVSADTAGTNASGGPYIYNLSTGPTGAAMMDLTPMELFLAPGDVLLVTTVASASSTVAVSLNWTEDI